ncbi:hypothetical protein ABZX77_46075 [Streptomyces sp. NPDC004237]|uniref:hypothetical protein n=1 Tax=Streptomyces sp. NPDC004237 TaxID=3154455 RepID=UPI0033BE26BE
MEPVDPTAVAHDVLRLGTPLLHQAVEEAVRQLGVEDVDEDLLRYLKGSTDDAVTSPPADGQAPAHG